LWLPQHPHSSTVYLATDAVAGAWASGVGFLTHFWSLELGSVHGDRVDKKDRRHSGAWRLPRATTRIIAARRLVSLRSRQQFARTDDAYRRGRHLSATRRSINLKPKKTLPRRRRGTITSARNVSVPQLDRTTSPTAGGISMTADSWAARLIVSCLRGEQQSHDAASSRSHRPPHEWSRIRYLL